MHAPLAFNPMSPVEFGLASQGMRFYDRSSEIIGHALDLIDGLAAISPVANNCIHDDADNNQKQNKAVRV